MKLQEDIQARTRSELEAARLAQRTSSSSSSSMPMSSRTTDSGWEYLSRDRVQAFPIGADIRSPEVHTPFAQRAASSASSPEKDITTSNDARAVRDRQLRELITMLGMTGRSSSSSSSAAKGVSYDGNLASDFAVAHVIAGETKPVALPKTIESPDRDTQLKRLEREVKEMRIEMPRKKKTGVMTKMTTVVLMTCMMGVLLQNLTVTIQGEARRDRTERDLVTTRPKEVIRMEAMIQSTLRSKFHVAKRTKSLCLLSLQ